jgi:hypothetical protein
VPEALHHADIALLCPTGLNIRDAGQLMTAMWHGATLYGSLVSCHMHVVCAMPLLSNNIVRPVQLLWLIICRISCCPWFLYAHV